MAKKLIDLVKRKHKEAVVDSHSRLGNDTVIIRPEHLLEVAATLRDDAGAKLDLLRDITAVDYLNRVPRFEVVYIFYSIELKHQLLVRVLVEEESCKVPSLHKIYPIAGWLEREVFHMYGVDFVGHPDLRRVLLYEEFEGHPLRKDYAVQASQPRVALRARERDAVEEFKEFVQNEEAKGSRERY